jgi:choline transport protein
MYVPVNAVNISYMNWSCLIVGATIIFPGLYWIFRARHKYLKESNSVLEDNIVVVDGVAISGAEAIKH